MPFMIGEAPLRRTLKYLKDWRIFFRDTVRIFSISYDDISPHHAGARDFVYWHLPQIQYNNPEVQCITFKELTPTPFIQVYFEDTSSLTIDLDSRKREDIVNHLYNLKAISKTGKEIAAERELKKSRDQFSVFGYGCLRHCACEIFGQIPCTAIVPLPNHWRGMPSNKPKLHVPPIFKAKQGEEK